MSAFGMNLRVTTDSKQGGRKYMEDCLSVKFEKSVDGHNIEYTYLGIFDGHGGVHAAQYAKEHLLDEITKQKGFWSNEDSQILKAIKEGFLSTHQKMWKIVGSWPKTLSGYASTAGTTVSVAFLRGGKMYVGHVGDSSVVVGKRKESMLSNLTGEMITVDHKPESPKELKRIEESGGAVVAKAGVQRVVWNRPRSTCQGAVRRSTPIDRIPFLAIARALGDLWSYNTERDVFVVSPEPDVQVYDLDVRETRCVVLASDGLWNMVRAQECVDLVDHLDEQSKDPATGVKPASCLVRLALDRWSDRGLRADNTSVIVCIFDPPDDEDMESPLPSKQAGDLGLAPLASLSDGEDECLSDSDCSDEDIDMDVEADDDGNMSHLHMGSPAPFPKIMYPSPHFLKRISENRQNATPDRARCTPNTKNQSRPSLSLRTKLKTPKSAPPKVKRLNNARQQRLNGANSPVTCPVRKVKGSCRPKKFTMAEIRKRLGLLTDHAEDSSQIHNLRMRSTSPSNIVSELRILSTIDVTKVTENDNASNEYTHNAAEIKQSTSDALPTVIDSTSSCSSKDTSTYGSINQQNAPAPVTPSKQRNCPASPTTQALSAKSPLRVHTGMMQTLHNPSLISPMWPNTLDASDLHDMPCTEEPLEGGDAEEISQFTALSKDGGAVSESAHVATSPHTRACVRKLQSLECDKFKSLGIKSSKNQAAKGGRLCVKKVRVKSMSTRLHAGKCLRTNKRLSIKS